MRTKTNPLRSSLECNGRKWKRHWTQWVLHDLSLWSEGRIRRFSLIRTMSLDFQNKKHFPGWFLSRWKRIQKNGWRLSEFNVQHMFVEIVNASIVKSIIGVTDVTHHSVDLNEIAKEKIAWILQKHFMRRLFPEPSFWLHRPSRYSSESGSWTHLSSCRSSHARSSFVFYWHIFWHTTILQHCRTDTLILRYIYPTLGAPSYVLEELDQISVFKKSSLITI